MKDKLTRKVESVLGSICQDPLLIKRILGMPIERKGELTEREDFRQEVTGLASSFVTVPETNKFRDAVEDLYVRAIDLVAEPNLDPEDLEARRQIVSRLENLRIATNLIKTYQETKNPDWLRASLGVPARIGSDGVDDSLDPSLEEEPLVALSRMVWGSTKIELIEWLQTQGWRVETDTSPPKATNPDGTVRVWFYPTGPSLAHGSTETLDSKTPTSMEVGYDISGPELIAKINEWQRRLTEGQGDRLERTAREVEARKGLYGFPKKIQTTSDQLAKRLARAARRIAQTAYDQDMRVYGFLKARAEKGCRASGLLVDQLKRAGALESDQAPRRAREVSGLFGWGERTSNVGLRACSDLEREAGLLVAKILDGKSDKLSAFIEEHALRSDCSSTKLLAFALPTKR